MTTVQQIVYTDHPDRWHVLAAALGLVAPSPPSREWAEFDGDGVLAVHAAGDEHPAGRVDLHLLVADLDAAAKALAVFDATRSDMAGVGPMVTVRSRTGAVITVSEGERAAAPSDLAVQPICFAADLDEPRAILEALGMRSEIAADGGGWFELRGAGGRIGLHLGDEPRIGLSFLGTGDLDALTERVRAAGFDAAVVDEAFSRTVRIADPDGGDEVWINGVQDDLYGYHRVEAGD